MLKTRRLNLLILIPSGMRIFHYILPLVTAIANPWSVYPQNSADSSRYTFEELVITATRVSMSNLKASNSIEVITKADWSRRNAQTVTDVLATTAGLEIRDYGGRSGAKFLSMRGSTGEQVVIMRNGVRINNPAHGLADLSLLNLDEVERIEVYRGGASALYGSDAVGGVVNIITQHDVSRGLGGSVYGSVSSFNHYCAQLSLRSPMKSWNGAISYRRELQPDSSYDVNDPWSRNSVRRVNTLLSVHAVAGEISRIEDRYSIFINSQWMSRHAELPGTIQNNSSNLADEKQGDFAWSINPQLEWRTSETWQIQGSMAFTSTQITYNGSRPFIDSETRTKSLAVEASSHWRVFSWTRLHAGYGLVRSSAMGSSDEGIDSAVTSFRFETPSIYQHGFFLSNELTWIIRTPFADLLRLDPFLRYDYFKSYGSVWSPKIGLSLTKRYDHWYHTMRASTGGNFRAPTLNERFWLGDGANGNPEIKPERSHAIDAGFVIGHSIQPLSWQAEANIFRIDTKDQIVWLVANPVTPVNLKRTRASGFECILQLSLDSVFSVTANFTRNRSVDRSDRERTYRAVNSPLYSAKYSASYRRGVFDFYGTTRYISERFVNLQNTVVLDPYWIVDVGAGVSWKTRSVRCRFFVEARNVLNEAYETVSSYPGTAREIGVSLKLSY